MKDNSYVVIQGWMYNLGLKDLKEISAFALIYGFSQDLESEFKGSKNYIADFLVCSRKTAINVMKSLEEKGVIEKRVETINNVTFNRYAVSTQVVKKLHRGSVKTTQGGSVKTTQGGSVKITHNNTNIDNTNIDNKEYNKDKDILDEIYSAYPNRCVVNDRPTGKSKMKHYSHIRKTLKIHPHKELLAIIKRYTQECKETGTFMKNFGTFLNNIPDFGDSNDIPFRKEAEKFIETGIIDPSVTIAKLAGKSYNKLLQEFKKFCLEQHITPREDDFNDWCIRRVKERYTNK